MTQAEGAQAQAQTGQTPSTQAPQQKPVSGQKPARRIPLTDEYEMIRHSTDSAMLSRRAHEKLPPKSDQAAYSRQTALLEAVAGNLHTPIADRVYLATVMPFPNILVKLASDPRANVRQAVAGNKNDKNWLVGRLAKDKDQDVRTAALLNPRTFWKMRLEEAQDPSNSVKRRLILERASLSITDTFADETAGRKRNHVSHCCHRAAYMG